MHKVPYDGERRRAPDRSRRRRYRRSADHARRALSAQVAARRAPAVLGRAPREDESRRTTAGAARAGSKIFRMRSHCSKSGCATSSFRQHHRARANFARLHRSDPGGPAFREIGKLAATLQNPWQLEETKELARRRHADQAALRPRVHGIARAVRYVSCAPSSASSSKTPFVMLKMTQATLRTRHHVRDRPAIATARRYVGRRESSQRIYDRHRRGDTRALPDLGLDVPRDPDRRRRRLPTALHGCDPSAHGWLDPVRRDAVTRRARTDARAVAWRVSRRRHAAGRRRLGRRVVCRALGRVELRGDRRREHAAVGCRDRPALWLAADAPRARRLVRRVQRRRRAQPPATRSAAIRSRSSRSSPRRSCGRGDRS